MKKITFKILILVATICLLRGASSQCIRYNGSLCLECFKNYLPNGSNCVQDLVQIKSKNINSTSQSIPTEDSQQNGFNLTKISNTLRNTLIPEASSLKQPIITKDNEYQAVENQVSSSNSLNLVKISPYDSSQITAATNKQPLSLSEIKQFSISSSYIQGIYSNFSQQILQYELNKISLQLFQFTRMRSFDYRYDPMLREVLSSIQKIYGQKLKKFTFLTAYFRYISFAKIYKVFYSDLSSTRSIQIDLADSMVDLFHMQVFVSSCRVYSSIVISESTMESIRNSTRLN